VGADLAFANLYDADLEGAHLEQADLSGAFNLTQQQIDSAHGNQDTKLPPDLHIPESWKKSATQK
jgi:uncharacterized protein YjbI with pentapeptide repeats